MSNGILRSRAKFPITVSYGEHNIVVSPGASLAIVDTSLLQGNLPKELVLIVKA